MRTEEYWHYDPPIKLKFNSLSELAHYIDTHPQVVGTNSSELNPSRMDWDYNMSFKEADRILRSGGYWKEGHKNLQRAVFEFEQAMNMGLGPSTELDVAGFAPDVSEFLKGSPTCMVNESDDGLVTAQRPIVKVGINTAIMCNVDAEYPLNRGAAIITLIDYLESMGQRCEIWSLMRLSTHHKDEPPLYVDTLIKPAHLPWDPGSFAFSLIHPAWFRRIMFRVIESRHEWPKSGGFGYGCAPNSIEDIEDWDIFFGELSNRKDSEIHDPTSHYESPEKAIEYIQKIAKEIRGG